MTVAVGRIGRDGSLPAMANIYDPDFDEPREHPGYRGNERRPDGGGLREVYRRSDAVDYYEGESR